MNEGIQEFEGAIRLLEFNHNHASLIQLLSSYYGCNLFGDSSSFLQSRHYKQSRDLNIEVVCSI